MLFNTPDNFLRDLIKYMMKKIIDSNLISNHLTAEDHTEYAPYIQSIYDSTYQKTNINDPKSASY